MPKPKEDPIPREVRRALSEAYSFVRSREVTETVAAITMEELIVEQILFLDSDQEAQGNTAESSDKRLVGSWGLGYLQRLESLEERLLDSDTGAIAQLKDTLQEARENASSASAREGQEQ
jgi:hypothetical protein